MESSVVGECTNTSTITSPVYALELTLVAEVLRVAAVSDLDGGIRRFAVQFSAPHNVHPVDVLASACYPVCAMSFVRPFLYFIACSSQLMSNDIATSLDICLHRNVLFVSVG